MNKVEREFVKKGVDLDKLVKWLTAPKQGIAMQVAAAVIKEVAEEFIQKKRYHLECLMYSEPYREKLAEGLFPEHFWVDRYVLERCNWMMEDLIQSKELDINPLKLAEKILEIEGVVKQTRALVMTNYKMIKPIRDFLTIPPYIRMIFGGFISYSIRRVRSNFRRS